MELRRPTIIRRTACRATDVPQKEPISQTLVCVGVFDAVTLLGVFRCYPRFRTMEPVARRRRAGFINGDVVRALSFWITTLCILIAVVASLLAIWEFTGTDVLWRTVATCAVIAGGTSAFSIVNSLYGRSDIP